MECFTCEFTQDLVVFTDDFARRGSAIFFEGILPVAKTILTLSVLILGIKLMIDRDSATFGRAFSKLTIVSVVVAVFLSTPLLIFNWFLWPVQGFAVDAANAMMQTFSPAGGHEPPRDLMLYARLVWNVEYMIQWVMILAASIIEGGSWWPGDAIQRFLGGMLLLAPWLFIAILQAAYMVEAAFMFALAGIMSPILMAVYIAPVGRAYLPAMLRILLGSSLTIVFAAIVISFTGFAVQKHQTKVRAVLNPDGDDVARLVADAEEKKVEACKDVNILNVFENDADENRQKCIEAIQAVQEAGEPPFKLFDSYFITLLAIGFISVLFHLKAKTWATNLAGVQDGPGAAAGIATVVTGAVGAGLAISKGLLGRGIGGAGNAANMLRDNAPSVGGGGPPGVSGGSTPSPSDLNGLRGGAEHSLYTPPPANSGVGAGLGDGLRDAGKGTTDAATVGGETKKGGLRE